MKMGIAVLCLCLLSAALWLGLTMTMSSEGGGPGGGPGGGGGEGGPGKPGGGGSGSSGCVPQSIPSEDIDVCKALDVLYTELGIISCKIIPQCNQYREKITLWPQPTVKFPGALDGATYLLVMVDPDAPSRQDPRAKYWRHWLVSNIPGTSMKSGTIQGQVITEYQPPTPPPTTGLHRYQFFIYLQGTRNISISARENKNRGSWRLETFLQQHRLDDTVTSTQFMTEFEGELPPGFDRSGRKAKD